MRTRHVWTIASLALLVAGCGSKDSTSPGGGNGGSTSSAIDVRDNSYSPSLTTLPVGSVVTWTWRGAATHDVTFSSTTHSPTQSSGSYQRTFTAAGTYDYHCSIHGTAMSGRIVVQ